MNRRTLLQIGATAAGGLFVGLTSCTGSSPSPTPASEASVRRVPTLAREGTPLTAWIQIEPDDTVALTVAESEMGQGVLTALAMVLADELDVDWAKVAVFHAPANEGTYGRQSTGGSTSVRKGYAAMREVAATARTMLRTAAAAKFGLSVDECTAKLGVVEGGGKRATYGELAADASTLPSPDGVELKAPSDFRYIGKPLPRLDIPAKVDGGAVFGIDVSVPGMMHASIEHCPIFGGQLASFDDTATRVVPGVLDVVEVPTGVAVVATNTWAAFQGRRALKVEWSGDTTLDTAAVRALCKEALATGKVARDDGNVDAALGDEALDAFYEAPYLAHTPMEPMSCTVALGAGQADIWVGTQSPTATVKRVAEITGLDDGAIRVHTAMLGGGFGRRSQTDFVADAVHVAKAVGKPVKATWMREDDVRGGWYRPYAANRLRGTMAASGELTAWWHQIASPHIRGYDGPTLEGAENLPYAVANCRVSAADPDLPVPVWWWRSVGSSQNAWVTECFFDELCRQAGQDPLAARRRLLKDQPRHLAVLNAAAEKAGYGAGLEEGHAHGVAVHASFGSVVAQVAEVSIVNGKPRVHRVVCAVDCGQVVNPNTIVAQMESGIVYGLSATLYGAIDLAEGRAVPSNFHDYRALTIDEMPTIETIVMPDGSPHGGIGEPGTPPVAPAVCNALLALTGKPIRRLPIQLA
ncbi:MAG: xanthine dehydrogenase family protein molybdopterin-binding subunit [Myxococcota bacterium]